MSNLIIHTKQLLTEAYSRTAAQAAYMEFEEPMGEAAATLIDINQHPQRLRIYDYGISREQYQVGGLWCTCQPFQRADYMYRNNPKTLKRAIARGLCVCLAHPVGHSLQPMCAHIYAAHLHLHGEPPMNICEPDTAEPRTAQLFSPSEAAHVSAE